MNAPHNPPFSNLRFNVELPMKTPDAGLQPLNQKPIHNNPLS
tara:strand:+ start:306 stop:431 length:126 start_codon:yes stop_codon:yes gene_type:complete